MEKLGAASEFFAPPVIALCARLRFCMIYASANSFTRGRLDNTRIPNQTKCFTMRNFIHDCPVDIPFIQTTVFSNYTIILPISECLFQNIILSTCPLDRYLFSILYLLLRALSYFFRKKKTNIPELQLCRILTPYIN